jgi:hypothetical protein
MVKRNYFVRRSRATSSVACGYITESWVRRRPRPSNRPVVPEAWVVLAGPWMLGYFRAGHLNAYEGFSRTSRVEGDGPATGRTKHDGLEKGLCGES